MSTKNPFYVPPPTDYQDFGTGKFLISYAGRDIKVSFNGGNSWQYLPTHVDLGNPSTKLEVNESLNSDNKTITVPDGILWEIKHIFFQYSTTATSGSRSVHLQLLDDGDDVIYNASIQTVGANSWIKANCNSSVSSIDTTANWPWVNLPEIKLRPGYSIKIFAWDVIDSNDDIDVQLLMNQYHGFKKKDLIVDASQLLISYDFNLYPTEQEVQIVKLD
jgi:hypothetical protein